MAKLMRVLEKFMKLADDMEDEIIEENERKGFYNGIEYSRKDFNDMRTAINNLKKHYECRNRASGKYLTYNPEYNRLQRKMSYYRVKQNKTEKDYIKMEEIQNQIREYLLKKDIKKMTKILNKKKLKQKELEDIQKINEEVGEKYGFFD